MYSSIVAIYYIFGQSYLVNIRGIFSDCEVYIMGMKYIYWLGSISMEYPVGYMIIYIREHTEI